MKRPLLAVFAWALVTGSAVIGAAPTPGCGDFTSPGTWTEVRGEFGDTSFAVSLTGDGLTYRFDGAKVFLTNAPNTFWYSPSDTNAYFEFNLGSAATSIRTPADPPVNGGYTEVEVSSRGGPFIFLAAYAGFPTVTEVPPDPDAGTSGYTIITAPFSSARLCVGTVTNTPSMPLTISATLSGSPQVELSWNSTSNGLYQVQSCSDFAEDIWADLGVALAGTGAALRVVHPVDSNASQRFYRVLGFP